MAILLGLLALLLPAMMARQERVRINEAKIKVRQFGDNLELYVTENRGYPTTEQGLMALFLLPDNIGVPTVMQQPGALPGTMPGSMPTDMGTGAFGGGEAVATGPAALGAPSAGTLSAGTPTLGMQQGMPQGMPTPGLTDPSGGMGMGAGMGMPGAAGTGMMGGAMSTWTQPTYNPAIYTQNRRRPQPYVESEKDLIDPWGTPYRYENNLQYYGVNRTGTAKPAIWSAGPNKLDGDDDDIPNWDPIEAQQLIAQRQQMGTGMGAGMGGNFMQNPMMPNSMPNQMMPQAGGAMPNQMPNQMMPPTGGAMPNQMPNQMMPPTGGAMPNQMPNQMMPPTGGAMPNQMPNQMMPPTGGAVPNQMPNQMMSPTGM